MQLFLTPLSLDWSQWVVTEQRVVYQLRTVLRAREWYACLIHDYANNMLGKRCEVIIRELHKDRIEVDVQRETLCDCQLSELSMLVAFPNSSSKLELIVQKLTELWVKQIAFRRAARSQRGDVSLSKQQRLQTIMIEAVEQSFGWQMPELIRVDDVQQFVNGKQLRVFDCRQQDMSLWQKDQWNSLWWVVWPEWWLTNEDYQQFAWAKSLSVMSLWSTVLRMETAAIVGAYDLLTLSSQTSRVA